ncbi:MAG: TaqI-like C-terminal specificity domain-containing protein [Anaerolineae bacterium]
MPIAPEIIHDRLAELPRRRSLDATLELFDALGYQYADELPLPTRDWPDGVQSLVNRNAEPPIYLAQHRDFHVVYTHLTTDNLSRTVERPIVEHTLHKLHPYALFVFANRDLTLWDFVNVKYVAEDGARRRTIRRIHVGPNERLHTAAQRMALLAVPAPDTSALELQSLHDRAFDVEEVTRQFYRDYVGVFDELCKDIARRNPHCQAEIEAQVLLDRLLFLYFIQKKRWLDGRLDYLYQRFQAHCQADPDGTGFYHDFLFPLFVALSNEDTAFPSLGDVPFLNGGLFEVPADTPLADQLAVSNNAFHHAFDDLLECYNFTVREDTPLDVEVAIDPEMLGQIFENLVLGLERGEDRRKATGSYYTPRVIVHFMCRQALKEYLATESGLDPTRLEALMDIGPAEQLTPEEVAALNEMITEPEARLLRGLVEGARVLDPAVGSGAFLVGMLYEMVALTKLLDVRLHGQARVQRRNYDYDLKRGFIERNLYGVDIQPEAVRICELRQWLSLMVDYERRAGEAVPTLPNLSYRVRVGDSLIERLFGEPVQLDQLADDAVARQLIDRIQTEKQAYFKEPDLWEKQRRELRILGLLCELAAKLVGAKRGAVLTQMSAQVPPMGDEFLSKEHRKLKEAFEAELARYAGLLEQVKGVYERVRAMQSGEVPIEARDVDALRTQLGLSFLWRLDFAEVFADKGGFDVVIANPPYIRQERFSEQKPLLKAAFPDVYQGVADLYVYFYRRGLALARLGGVLTFISSNKFFRAGYGEALRTYLRDNTRLRTVIDFGDLPIFEATTYPCVLVVSNRRPGDGETRMQALNVSSMATLEYLADAVQRDGWPQPQRSLHPDGWAFERPEVLTLLEKLRRSGTLLGEYVGGKFYRGIVTGLNEAFVIDQTTRDRLVAEDPRNVEIIKPWLRGRDVKRWRVDWAGHYLIWAYRGIAIENYPAVLEYLTVFKDRLAKRWEPSRGQCEWYELRPCDYYAEFEKPKIIWPDIAKQCEFAIDKVGAYLDATAFIIPEKDYFLLAILNSSVTEWFIYHISSSIQQGFFRFKRIYLSQLAIPDATLAQRAAIEALVRKLLDAKGQGPQVAEWERELNALVYELYGLTEGEIGVVEGLDHE